MSSQMHKMKSPEIEKSPETEFTINDLPDEVIEFVLSFVPPYKDLHDCMQVCKRWRTSVLNVVRVKRRKLIRALTEFNVHWQCPLPIENAPTIAKRYSHSAVVHDNSMYVFGGCTNSMTTFNDLWRLDLSNRLWIRPLASGNYPTPKACSSLVCYRDTLVLFGGWAYPCSYPFHQEYQLFNELHSYSILDNRWKCIDPGMCESPPPLAGHSVSVQGKYMVVFGGMERVDSTGPLVKTNDLWRLDLEQYAWERIKTTGPKPRERYGHSQTAIGDHHILIMGGCGGPNGLYSDVWLLTMNPASAWTWRQVEVRNTSYAPPDIWCHPTCRVGEHIVILNRPRAGAKTCWRPPQRERRPHIDENPIRPQPHPGGSVPRVPSNLHDAQRHGLSLSAFGTQPHKPTRVKNREKQLEFLRKMENLIKNRQGVPQTLETQPKQRPRKSALSLYLLDITGALQIDPWVAWVQPGADIFSDVPQGPEETLLYTLVHGKAELIMFGGIQKDANGYNMLIGNLDPNTGSTKVSNSLHFIGAPSDII